MKQNKNALYIALCAFLSMCLTSYSLFDRPAKGGRAEGLDIDYTDPKTGETRRKFAPLEAIFGGHDQTTNDRPSLKNKDHQHEDNDEIEDTNEDSSNSE
jgi:hypothetical protein